MIIEKITIKSFGMIRDMALEFSESINVIEGQNEAGKSTISAFIKYMLYGFDNSDFSQGCTERERRINWDTGEAQGSMNVSVKGKKYLITRSSILTEGNTTRPTYRETNSIIDLETGSSVFGKMPAGEVFFGVSRELFENTAFIGQIGDAGINEGSVKESIENILFSGSERINNQRAAQRVSEKMETLLHKNGMGGAIFDLMRRGDEFEAKFKKADEDNKEILAKEAKLYEIKKYRDQQAELLDKLMDLDNCYKNVLIIGDFDRLHDLEREYDEKCEEYNAYVEAHKKQNFVPDRQYLSDLAVARKGVDDAYRNLLDANSLYAEEKNAVGITREIEGAIELSDSLGGEKEVEDKVATLKKHGMKNILSIVGSALFIIAAIVMEIVAPSGILGTVLRIAFGLVLALGVALLGMSVVLLKKNLDRMKELEETFSTSTISELGMKIQVIAEARAKRDGMIRSTENARLAVERGKENYERAKDELLEVILRWGEEPPASGLNEFLDKLNEDATKYLEGRDKLLDEKMQLEIKVRELRASLQDKSEIDVRAQVPPLKRKVLNEIDHDSIMEGIEDCKLKIMAQDKLSEDVEYELSLLKMRAMDPGELYSKIQANDQRIEELKAEHKAYYVALKAIENSADNLRLEISPRLGEYSTKLMEIMTDKKYESFDVSNGLEVVFKSPTGESRSVDFLSGGTRDLTYVALRMALVDMLYTEKPPIIFDESFAHQDNIRANLMMKAIKYLADDNYQSFIFTCRAREAALAREVSKDSEVFKLSRSDEALI